MATESRTSRKVRDRRITDLKQRLIQTGFTEEDREVETSLRPKKLDNYIGQKKIKDTVRIAIEAAKGRKDPLDHILFYGPPGLGKTTLAQILANEMGVHIKITSGPAIEKPGDMASILNGLKAGDILFIDEIHRLNKQVEEVLYPAMEDYAIDIMIGKGATAKSIRLDLPKFTLVGATTRAGLLSAPLRDRFGMILRMEFYTIPELSEIILNSAKVLKVSCEEEAATEMAKRSRGTPRLANRILKRVRDYAQVRGDGKITKDLANTALDLMDIDKMGLDHNDQRILHTLIETFDGGPAGLDTIAAAVGEDAGTIEDVIEPYLLQNGLIQRTPRGRIATRLAYEHLGLAYPSKDD
jgi:Holliday junction DNA helicase RuvB